MRHSRAETSQPLGDLARRDLAVAQQANDLPAYFVLEQAHRESLPRKYARLNTTNNGGRGLLLLRLGLHEVLELLADLLHLRERHAADVRIARIAGDVVLVVRLGAIEGLERLDRRHDLLREDL